MKKNPGNTRKKYFCFLIIVFIAVLQFNSCKETTEPEVTVDSPNPYSYISSIHVSLGVPYDKDTTDDYILVKPQYVLSYNKLKNVPNWVSWELNKEWFGDVSRYSGNFIKDTSLPAGFYRVMHSDYTNSGYDRGHMCPSYERTNSVENNKATFFLTNIVPQLSDLNSGVWQRFEEYCQDICLNQDKEMFLISGGVYHTSNMIKNLIAIPDSCFKIVVILDKGQGIKDITENTQTVAVFMPNISGVRSDDWNKYKTTIRKIEQSTGYNFLSEIPQKIQDVIENK
jgi:endonuclease G, mitochondrial